MLHISVFLYFISAHFPPVCFCSQPADGVSHVSSPHTIISSHFNFFSLLTSYYFLSLLSTFVFPSYLSSPFLFFPPSPGHGCSIHSTISFYFHYFFFIPISLFPCFLYLYLLFICSFPVLFSSHQMRPVTFVLIALPYKNEIVFIVLFNAVSSLIVCFLYISPVTFPFHLSLLLFPSIRRLQPASSSLILCWINHLFYFRQFL